MKINERVISRKVRGITLIKCKKGHKAYPVSIRLTDSKQVTRRLPYVFCAKCEKFIKVRGYITN